jgi:hypothetical protein
MVKHLMPSSKWGSTTKLETIYTSVSRQTVIIYCANKIWSKINIIFLPSQQSELLNQGAKCSRIVKFLVWIDLTIASPKVFMTLGFITLFSSRSSSMEKIHRIKSFHWLLFPKSDISTRGGPSKGHGCTNVHPIIFAKQSKLVGIIHAYTPVIRFRSDYE